MITWWILSPHPDDAVLSLGGFMLQASSRGERVEVVSIYDQSSANECRQHEDAGALNELGAGYHSLGLNDAPDRSASYKGYAGLLLHIVPDESVDLVRSKLGELLPQGKNHRLIVPLGIGGHIDHLNVYEAAKDLAFAFYVDLPYAYSIDLCRLLPFGNTDFSTLKFEDWSTCALPFFSSITRDTLDYELFKLKLEHAIPRDLRFDRHSIQAITLSPHQLLQKWKALTHYHSQLPWIFGANGKACFIQQTIFHTEILLTLESL